jgi:hypothetical protein
VRPMTQAWRALFESVLAQAETPRAVAL